MKDTLGDRLKQLEQMEAGRAVDNRKPLMCRLDGRSFHTFTKGLERPYDKRLSDLMVDTTKFLVEHTCAKLGYCQSDEISLYWDLDSEAHPLAQYLFRGKYQKIASITAGMASGFFNKELEKRIPEKSHLVPVFDSRVWNVEDARDVYLNFLWRREDAVKNSISMLAQSYYSHQELHQMNSNDKMEMMIAKGRPWDSEPEFFKTGTFVKRVSKEVQLTPEQWSTIPEKHRPSVGRVVRTVIEAVPVSSKRITITEWNDLIDNTDTSPEAGGNSHS